MSTRAACLAALASMSLVACDDAPKPKPPAPTASASKPTPSARDAGADAATEPRQPSADASSPTPPTFLPTPDGGWKVSGQDDDPKVLEVGGLRAPKPTTWIWQQPTVQFRTLQYAVPADKESTGAAELVVSFFEGSDAGGLEPNLRRWRGQFRMPDGAAVTPVESERTVDGMAVHLIELAGTYSGMSGSGPKADQLQLGAIVFAPGGSVFLRLIGPKEVVEKERENFATMIDGLKKSTG